MIPRMRPSSTRKSTPSSAMVVPKALRRPRASMHVMDSALLLFGFRLCGLRRRPAACGRIQELFRVQAEPLNGFVHPGPFLGEKLLAFALQQQTARASLDEHAETSFALDKLLVYQLLIALENRERIDSIFRRDIAHGGQRIAFLENSIEYHRDHTVAKLAVNRLTVVPFTVHPVFQIAPARDTDPSSCSLHVEVSVHWFIALPHECPVLGVMVRVEDGEHRM